MDGVDAAIRFKYQNILDGTLSIRSFCVQIIVKKSNFPPLQFNHPPFNFTYQISGCSTVGSAGRGGHWFEFSHLKIPNFNIKLISFQISNDLER
jgi:hypothetical protein